MRRSDGNASRRFSLLALWRFAGSGLPEVVGRLGARSGCTKSPLARAQNVASRSGHQRCLALSRNAAGAGRLGVTDHAARREHSTIRPAALRPISRSRAVASQAPRDEPDRVVQRHGHDGRDFLRPPKQIPLGSLRVDGEHVGLDGGVCGAGRDAQRGDHP